MVGIWGIVNFITCFHTFCIFGDGSWAGLLPNSLCFGDVSLEWSPTAKLSSGNPQHHEAIGRYNTKRQSATRPSDQTAIRYSTSLSRSQAAIRYITIR